MREDFEGLADLADDVRNVLEARGLNATVKVSYESGVETTVWVRVKDTELVHKPDPYFPEVWSKSRTFTVDRSTEEMREAIYVWIDNEIPKKHERHTAFLLEKVGNALEEAERLSNGEMAEHLEQVTNLLKAGREALASNLLTFRRAA